MVVSYEALLECAFSLYLGSAASHFKCQLRGGLTQNKTKSKNVGQHDCDGCPKITVDDRIYKTQIGEYFEIKCYISSTEQCSNDVTWYKMENDAFVPVTVDSHIEIKWKKLSNVTMLLLLCFTNIQESNSGSYHCASGLAVGHSINVSVYDNDIMANISFRNDTTGMSKEEIRWTYVYSAAGTIAFVVMVIFVSIILLQRCKGHATPTETEQQQQQQQQQQSRGEAQSVPTPSGSYEMSAEEGKQERMKDDRSVTYATLDHHQLLAVAAGTPARARRLQEESSHYADILLDDRL
ncbi:uncharacterized protein LOC133144348 isoform X14 [Syngnathus typhle]|uniref:uncharacterized protein LOC133144348 isoform X14 n=1 Tax=Syngnathus typhle TaxID=161592 RepID=UPI002A6A9226|nr:uncharacterized protein LOC133144348 isoform X14 [Syngnathus typhle]